MARTILLMGIPRGGTTLACKLAGACDDTLALFEPMDVNKFAGRAKDDVSTVAAFAAKVRADMAAFGRAPSKQRGGLVPDNPISTGDGNGERSVEVDVGWIRPSHPLGSEYTLVIKHNAAFVAMLPELAASFECVALVRNPVEVLRSWASVPLPVRDGRLPAGERFDPALKSTLDATPNVFDRQLHLLNWLYGRIAAGLPGESVVRYEDIITTSGAALTQKMGLRSRASEQLTPRAGGDGRYVGLERLSEVVLLQGPWRHWYDQAALEHALRVTVC